MKAFLLAAGYGTRLKPITNSVPKCLIPIHGQPLLGWWLDLFNQANISDVLVNTHHLPQPVEDYITAYNKRNSGFTVHTFFEKELLGSGGTVRANREFVGSDEDFLICYADNLTDLNLSRLIDFHRSSKVVLTMALFRTNHPEQCGIASLDKNQRIVDFIEKPQSPKGNLANAGIYVATTELYNFFSDAPFLDFGKDVLPSLVGDMRGYKITEYLIDIGTLANYEKACGEWKYDHNENAIKN